MKSLWSEIDDLQGGPGQTFQLGGEEVLLVCRGGEATFSQTDDGFKALRDHDFEEHERVEHYDWSDLHGQEVTLLVIERIVPDDWGLHGKDPVIQTEIVARTKDGVYYFLPYDIGSSLSQWSRGDFKWKPKRDGLALLRTTLSKATPRDQALPLLGSEEWEASSDPVAVASAPISPSLDGANTTSAKAGSRSP